MKHIILRFGLILAILLTGCTKPGEEIINVSKKTTEEINSDGPNVYTTEDVAVRVGDISWELKKGTWQGKPNDIRSGVTYTPKDAKAIKTIDKYMKR